MSSSGLEWWLPSNGLENFSKKFKLKKKKHTSVYKDEHSEMIGLCSSILEENWNLEYAPVTKSVDTNNNDY